MSDSDTGVFYDQGWVPAPSEAQKRIFDRFVEQYLRDYDGYAACIRMGYSAQSADANWQMFLQEPYVANLIKDREENDEIDEEDELEKRQRMIIRALKREAHSFGAGSSHGARVAALDRLAKLSDMDKTKIEHTHLGGVMYVPPVETDPAKWESQSMPNQEDLHRDNGSRT
ncbi:terminase small subunit [Stenotrophomonas phage Siara]|uniref:Terminase small subunit n=1 Tax=Stenotrophomonas phage Siara TaxID=2859658 RepID=A0AAE8BHY2_9CAUD|nr:terminase small subunit [Stenotrophomonas phage Siara]QYW02034.1 terminase small subunit [Stenotrophomonas phage Siara]